MTAADGYTAHLEARNRELHHDLDQALLDANQSRALVAAADLVIGRQAAQLESQARTVTALRERIAAALDIAADPDGPECCEGCRIEAITDTLNGLTDQAAAAAAELDWMSAD